MSDKHFASVELLCGFNGSDAATTSADESPDVRALTFVGNAQLDTAQAKWSASSLLLDGSGDYVTAPDSADWTFAGAFTVEAFVRFSSLTGTFQSVLSHYNSFGDLRSWWLTFATDGSTLDGYVSTNGTVNSLARRSGLSLSAGVWYHVAMTRDASNVVRVFLDGQPGSTTVTVSGTLFNSTRPLAIGCNYSGGASTAANFFNGWIDEVRVTSGVCRYSAAFTPPQGPFTRGKRLGLDGQRSQPIIVY